MICNLQPQKTAKTLFFFWFFYKECKKSSSNLDAKSLWEECSNSSFAGLSLQIFSACLWRENVHAARCLMRSRSRTWKFCWLRLSANKFRCFAAAPNCFQMILRCVQWLSRLFSSSFQRNTWSRTPKPRRHRKAFGLSWHVRFCITVVCHPILGVLLGVFRLIVGSTWKIMIEPRKETIKLWEYSRKCQRAKNLSVCKDEKIFK